MNGSQAGGSVLDVGALGTAFDGRQAAGLAAVAPAGATPKLAGFYWGTRGSDFKPRLGEATSPDGTLWTKYPAAPTGGALFDLGNPAAFDNGGERDPSALYDASTYYLYFTGPRLGRQRLDRLRLGTAGRRHEAAQQRLLVGPQPVARRGRIRL